MTEINVVVTVSLGRALVEAEQRLESRWRSRNSGLMSSSKCTGAWRTPKEQAR
jgi:hypothetical protein